MFKFLWLDMEMTGLDIEKEVPIEIAVLVTAGPDLNEVDSYHAVIKQSDQFLKNMDEWNRNTHGESGLMAEVPSGKDINVVERELIEFINRHFTSKERPILAGNSIFQDRLFINKYFSRVAERIHYRMLDVTAFKVVFNNFYRVSYSKPESRHRAMDDIHESIGELKKYLSFVKFSS